MFYSGVLRLIWLEEGLPRGLAFPEVIFPPGSHAGCTYLCRRCRIRHLWGGGRAKGCPVSSIHSVETGGEKGAPLPGRNVERLTCQVVVCNGTLSLT